MRRTHLWSAVSALACVSCAAGSGIPVTPVQVTERRDVPLRDWATLAAFTQLTIPPDINIGNFSSVDIEATSRQLFVLDFLSTKGVYRFGTDGTFQQAYLATGTFPGSNPEISSIAPLPDGTLVMAGAMRLRRYDAHGALREEVPIKYTAFDLLASRTGDLWAFPVYPGGAAAQLFRLSHDMKERARVGRFDDRLAKYVFLPSRHRLASIGPRLFVTELYEPAVTEYDVTGRAIRRLQLPLREGEATPDLWSSTHLDDLEKRKVRDRVHVLTSMFSLGSRIFFFEGHRASNLSAPVLLDPDRGIATRFPDLSLLHQGGRVEPGRCSFPEVLGTDGAALIVHIDDPTLLAACISVFPELASANPLVVERPLLLFLKPT